MTKKADKSTEPSALTGSASITDPPALRVTMSDQDQIQKRANSYTAPPAANAEPVTDRPEPEK